MVFHKVAQILAEILEVDTEDITLETKLTNDFGIEALSVAKLVINCEKKLNITIHDEVVHTFKCVNDIVEYIEKIQLEI